MANYGMDGDKFRGTMNSLNYGTVMNQAARNLKKELENEDNQEFTGERFKEFLDVADLDEDADPDLVKIQRERLMEMRSEQEKRMEMARNGHGSYTEIKEDEFLPQVTNSQLALVHFYHQDFERCRIIDKHLQILAQKHFDTKFLKLHAPDAPFFVLKLQVQMLPCIVCFNDGKAFDRISGFDELGKRDDFPTEALEKRLLECGIIKPKEYREFDDESDDDESEQVRRVVYGGLQKGSDDEDSDFD